MAIIQGGVTTSKLEVDTQHLAARVTSRPMDIGTRGAYTLGVVSGVMAAGLAANSEIFQMRWVDATRLMLLRSIVFSAARGGTAFTAGSCEFYLTWARGWTADGGGGTAVVMSTNNTNKKRTSFPLSLFSDTGIRFSATAALTAGTKQLDTNRAASISAFISSATTAVPGDVMCQPGVYLWQRNTADEYPVVFAQNEGLVVRATVPATGTWQFSINVEWAEIDPALVTGW